MSIRLGIMALLAEEPMYGYQVRQEFESRTGGTWPLNVGQVYTTIGRLVRDRLVETASQGEAGHREGDDADTRETERYRLTATGRAEVGRWWRTPVRRDVPARDELTIKLALAVTVPGVDVGAIVQIQRNETMRALREYTLLKARADRAAHAVGGSDAGASSGNDLAWSLLLDNLVFMAEAEMRWLDHIESRLARAARSRSMRPAASDGVPRDTSAPASGVAGGAARAGDAW